MKTKKEIEKTIDGLKRLRKVIPEFIAFGDSNHDEIDEQTWILEQINRGILDPEEGRDDLEDRESHTGRAQLMAFDWALDDIDEPLYEESDIKMFSKNSVKTK